MIINHNMSAINANRVLGTTGPAMTLRAWPFLKRCGHKSAA